MPDFMEVLLNALPIVLLIGAWIYFMNRYRKGGFTNKYQTEYLDLVRAQTAVLERIAVALETHP